MVEQKERIIIALAISISAIILVAAVIIAMVGRRPAKQSYTEPYHHPEHNQPEPLAESTDEPVKTDAKPVASPELSLNDVIKARRYWNPVYTSWFGKPAPDFTLTDIAGKQHKLSDYRGKSVLIVFWAVWCPPCRIEIPELIRLRNSVSEDKLAILAISNEDPALVKKFVAGQKINYTVLLEKGNMPKPFGIMRIYSVTGIPCSFFIDSDGKIKLATTGILSLSEMKAILQAPLETGRP